MDSSTTQPAGRSSRKTKQPEYYGHLTKPQENIIKTPITTSDEPLVDKAMHSTPAEAKLWKQAVREKFRNLEIERAWSPILDKSQIRRTLNSHIVLKIKRDAPGRTKIFKAKSAAGGCRQRIWPRFRHSISTCRQHHSMPLGDHHCFCQGLVSRTRRRSRYLSDWENWQRNLYQILE